MSQSDGKHRLQRMQFEFKGNTLTMPINPQEFQQDEPNRSQVTQTKAGAWVDDFGGGLPQIYIKGTTGFRNGLGVEDFKAFRNLIRNYYNDSTPGQDIQNYLIFHNLTDEESWVVHTDPNSGFRLLRNVNNPLYYMYEIRLICLRPYSDAIPNNSVTVTIGNPYGSAIPSSKNVPNTPSTKLYQYAMPYIKAQISSDDDGKVPQSLSSWFSQSKLLSDGRIQVGSPPSLSMNGAMNSSAMVDVDPILEPYVSNLTVNMYNMMSSGMDMMYDASATLDSNSLVYKVINSQPIQANSYLRTIIQTILLEVHTIYYTLVNSPSIISNNLSQTDVGRCANNIRWISYQLAGTTNMDLDIINQFRWLERCMYYVKRSSDLYTKDINSLVSDYNNSLVGD